MSEDLKVLVERAEALKDGAFKITKDLLKRADVQALIRQGVTLYMSIDGKNITPEQEKKINAEMQSMDDFIADDTTMSFFRTERRAPYMVWGMVIEFMKQNPNKTTEELEEAFINNLPQRVHDTYNASAATY
jgi:hypothetical protein